jgi:hypothetical protein
VPVAGTAGNNVFNWTDTNGNGRCDFELWDDVNENGLYDAATESYVDVNGNGNYDQEWHEPLHDWGRDNDFITLDLDGSQGPASNAGKRQGDGVYQPGEIMVQSIVVPDFFSAMEGWNAITPNMTVTVSGLLNLKVNGQPLYSSDDATIKCTTGSGSLFGGSGAGGYGCWRLFAFNQIVPGDSPSKQFPLVSNPIRISGSSGTVDFSGGQITVQLSSATSNKLFQKFVLSMPPDPTLPVPKITATGTPDYIPTSSGTPPTAKEQWWAFSNYSTDAVAGPGRLANAGKSPGLPDSNPPIINTCRFAGAFFREKYDVVRGIVPRHGDFRIAAAQQTVSDPANNSFKPLPNYLSSDAISCQLSTSTTDRDLVAIPFLGWDSNRRYFAGMAGQATYRPYIYPNASSANRPEATGDFDNGLAVAQDGPYINKPDEGNSLGTDDFLGKNAPYFYESYRYTLGGTVLFSPNRIMPSSGMFGSLSSGVVHDTPWRTLLFRPQGSDFASQPLLTQHPASLTAPPDHLFMDLFWMPVVEPYAISEPFSTAGKVNMNYQIMPFTYIERSTALRAVFKAEKLGVILNSYYLFYKNNNPAMIGKSIRQEIDVNNAASAALKDTGIETLNQFAKKFADGKLFKSASEICDVHIVPTGLTAAKMPEFWNQAQPTGDNLRERIYTTLYPRLTTKSNSYTVHFRVQVLKKVPGTDVAQWVEGKDRTVSEYRGSTLVERYIDPGDPDLPDFSDPANTDTLDNHYKFRVVNTKKFTAE